MVITHSAPHSVPRSVPDLDVELSVLTGTSVHALVDLSRLSAGGRSPGPLGDALGEIGDRTGETWLHLLGACLGPGEPRSLGRLTEVLESMSPVDFRLLLLGYRAWSWRSIVGAETIEAAARGEPGAISRLLSDDRYYARSAAAALGEVLHVGPAETKRRFLLALDEYGQAQEDEKELADRLGDLVLRIEGLGEAEGWLDAIEILTGYRYVAEPEARRVVLMPHLAGSSLILAQHDDARLIVFGSRSAGTAADRALSLGQALSDASRIELLAALRAGPTQLGDLVGATALSRSTVHHHLRVLRDAGLVSVEGNARAYSYTISRRGRSDALVALAELLGVEKGDINGQ